MLKEKSNSDLERCAIIIRLRLYLKEVNLFDKLNYF